MEFSWFSRPKWALRALAGLMIFHCSIGYAQPESHAPGSGVTSALCRPSASRPNVRPSTHILQVSGEQEPTSAVRTTPLVDLGPGPDFASQLPDDDSQIIQLIEIVQWTVVVLLIAVVAVLALRKFGRGSLLPKTTSAIEHVATLPIKNHFQAHLIEVGKHTFLVTTDRSGVKTVNQVNNWQDFDSTIDDASSQLAAS